MAKKINKKKQEEEIKDADVVETKNDENVKQSEETVSESDKIEFDEKPIELNIGTFEEEISSEETDDKKNDEIEQKDKKKEEIISMLRKRMFGYTWNGASFNI